jgi:cytochrome c
MDPAKIAAVVERMRKMNPDWFVNIKDEHMIEVIARIIKDPALVSAREAWANAVERGQQLFEDTTLGKNGYNCKACHNPPEVLRNIADAYPRWDPELKRFVDINEAINRMLVTKLGGEQLPPNDQKLFDLLAYLKTLK